jgi:hypothetical protein
MNDDTEGGGKKDSVDGALSLSQGKFAELTNEISDLLRFRDLVFCWRDYDSSLFYIELVRHNIR